MGSTRLFAIVWVSISLLASAEMHAADSADCAGAVVDENSVPVGAAQVTRRPEREARSCATHDLCSRSCSQG